MKKLTNPTLLAGIFLLIPFLLFGQAWKMALAPLMTPWADSIRSNAVLPEYPRPVMQRDAWMNLNGIWQFQEMVEGEELPLGKKLKEEILVPFPWESAISGIRRQWPSQRAWYRRLVTIPNDWKKQPLLLHFGAVDWECKVYVNGRCVGTHQGGYDAFYFNIQPYLQTKGEQEIVVEVFDPGSDQAIATGKQTNDRFSNPNRYNYTGCSGIWQTVWLESVPRNHISDLHLTPDIDREEVTVQVDVATQIPKGRIRATIKQGENIVANGTGNTFEPFSVSLPNPRLWSPDDPFLYDVELELLDSTGQVQDRVISYVGMRKIALARVGNLQKIFLNNTFLFQMGPLDQGYWPDGIYTAPTDEALRWDIEQMKAMGYNMARKHIKIEPQRWYYWADKLGLLVWQDMPNTFKPRTETQKTQFESELSKMVKQHWNHPSIIIWVVFNEHWGIYDPVRLTEYTMALDPSRLVTGNSGIDAGKPNIDYETGHIVDNHHYRPPAMPFATNTRATVNGEYGAIGYLVPGHIWDTDGPWVHDTYENKEKATTEYEVFIETIRTKLQPEGLSGAVYTQWTDVENEVNGIYTYDRKIVKLDSLRVTHANQSTWQGQKKAGGN